MVTEALQISIQIKIYVNQKMLFVAVLWCVFAVSALTLWKSFCCLVLSAICLQDATNCCTSGEAMARLELRSCTVSPSRLFSESQKAAEVM